MHKTFISYHHANDQDIKDEIIKYFAQEDFIDKSVHEGDIDTETDENNIIRQIREEYISDSTVTLVIVGSETAQREYINSEIQASLWGDNYNGLLAVVRDEIYNEIYTASTCTNPMCNCGIELRLKTPSYSKYLPDLVRKNHEFVSSAPHYNDSQVYCSILKYSTFVKDVTKAINEAFDKRNSDIKVFKKNSSETPCIKSQRKLW